MTHRATAVVFTTAAIMISVTVAVGAGSAAAQQDSPRLPDLVAAEPGNLRVEAVGGRWQLGFSSAIENEGSGDLIVDGRAGGEAERMDAVQLIPHADGTESRRPLPVPLRYIRDGGHNHWHLIAAMRYELRTLDGEVAARDVKNGFCLGDRYLTTPTEHRERRYVTNCGAGQPALTALRMGISPGFGDRYRPFLEGQQIDIHDLASGEYRLVHRANPDGALEESDTSNNESSLVVRVAHPNGRDAAPVVTPR